MFVIMNRISDVNVPWLEDVYVQTIMQLKSSYTHKTDFEAEAAARDRFAEDLRDFLRVPYAKIIAMTMQQRFVSSLRIEPYLDGVLFSYLETTPTERGKGYAKLLVDFAIEHMADNGISTIYSHVKKSNHSSLSVHFANSFAIHTEYAKLLDGTVTQNYYTLIYESTAG